MTLAINQRHWPEFEAVLCGDMTDRERLGLPNHYLADRFSARMQTLYQQLRLFSVEQLLAMIDANDTDLVTRIAAGNLLALIGDPRIDTKNPTMIDIPANQAWIGLDYTDVDTVLSNFDKLGLNADWIRKECPRHCVELSDYRIAKYPVTNQEYRDFLLDSGYPEIPSSWSFRRFPIERANHPVYTLSAQACDAYGQWLSVQTGRKFRLPTEAEWEFAASGTEGREFPWGARFDENLANTCETGLFETTPVGVFQGGESCFQVYDMAGNVEEYADRIGYIMVLGQTIAETEQIADQFIDQVKIQLVV